MHIIDKKFFKDTYASAPTKPPEPLISEYIAKKRVLPPNTPYPGPWRNSRTPYLVEIMDNMSPMSPIKHIGAMKGAQIGFTASAENVTAYWMDEFPAEILYISATEKLLEKWATKRLEPLIDSCGFRYKIFSQSESKSTKRIGDKTFSKEFIGGNLNMASAQSASSLRSDSIRILLRDEIDGAPPLLRTGEGSWLEVSWARTFAFGARAKIMDFSTPTTWERSEINGLYESGDQRKYRVPCPYCGKKQVLRFGSESTQYGIKADKKGGVLIQAYYMCEYCHDAIFNHHKTRMLRDGGWEPTTKSSDPLLRTYHIASFYSPVGMLSWTDVWHAYEKALQTPDGMRSFVNLYAGLPYKEDGYKPKIDKVIELRGGYRHGTIPRGMKIGDKDVYIGPLYLTAGADVQTGSKMDSENPPRIELEIMATGIGYRTWSIGYYTFTGLVGDPYSGAWEKLHEWAVKGGLSFKRSDGVVFKVAMMFIDSGDGNVMDVVYRFTKRWVDTYPSKGFSALKRRKGEKIDDEAGPSNFRRYRPVKVDEDTTLLEISTNYYKTQVYNSLNVQRQPLEPQKPGFCDFPVDYSEKYFKMLTAEEKRSDGSFHCPSGVRNEALDTRVMALCASDFYLDLKVQELKVALKQQGATAADIMKINQRVIIDQLSKRMK